MYLWQDPYLSALTEMDDSKLYARILEARSALEQRFLSPIDDEELHAMDIAAAALDALDALERKRPNIARRISEIRTGNPRSRFGHWEDHIYFAAPKARSGDASLPSPHFFAGTHEGMVSSR
jgi:hypothetical protein